MDLIVVPQQLGEPGVLQGRVKPLLEQMFKALVVHANNKGSVAQVMAPLLDSKEYDQQLLLCGQAFMLVCEWFAYVCDGVRCCTRTAPMHCPESSVSISKGRVKSGKAKARAVVRASLSCLKAWVAQPLQIKEATDGTITPHKTLIITC